MKNKYLVYSLKIGKGITLLCAVFLAVLAILTVAPVKTPIKPFVVLTGSMRPTIFEGSLVFVQRGFNNVQKGDIITFKRPDKPQENVTHRVIATKTQNGQLFYRTKGDNNNAPDLWLVRKEAIWGEVAFTVPFLGYVISFAQTKVGIILLVLFPALLIVIDEIRVIVKEIQTLRKSKKEKSNTHTTVTGFLVLFLAILLSRLHIIPTTYAAFLDAAAASSQQVRTAWWIRPTVLLLNPISSQTFHQKKSYDITWQATSDDPTASISISLYYSTDGGQTYPHLLAENQQNNGHYAMHVPEALTNNFRIKLIATDSHGLQSEATSQSDNIIAPSESNAQDAASQSQTDQAPQPPTQETENTASVSASQSEIQPSPENTNADNSPATPSAAPTPVATPTPTQDAASTPSDAPAEQKTDPPAQPPQDATPPSSPKEDAPAPQPAQ